MPFKSLLYKSMRESELLKLLVNEIQKNYQQYQGHYYFIKLQHTGDNLSEMTWVKAFTNPKDLADFHFESKFMKASVMLKFCKDRYELLCIGYFHSDQFEIWPDNINDSRPRDYEFIDQERSPHIPRDLIEAAFKDFQQALASSKGDIPV